MGDVTKGPGVTAKLDEVKATDELLLHARRLAVYLATESAGTDPDKAGFLEVVMLPTNAGPVPKAFLWFATPAKEGEPVAQLFLDLDGDGCPEWKFEGRAVHHEMVDRAMTRSQPERPNSRQHDHSSPDWRYTCQQCRLLAT